MDKYAQTVGIKCSSVHVVLHLSVSSEKLNLQKKYIIPTRSCQSGKSVFGNMVYQMPENGT